MGCRLGSLWSLHNVSTATSRLIKCIFNILFFKRTFWNVKFGWWKFWPGGLDCTSEILLWKHYSRCFLPWIYSLLNKTGWQKNVKKLISLFQSCYTRYGDLFSNKKLHDINAVFIIGWWFMGVHVVMGIGCVPHKST